MVVKEKEKSQIFIFRVVSQVTELDDPFLVKLLDQSCKDVCITVTSLSTLTVNCYMGQVII